MRRKAHIVYRLGLWRVATGPLHVGWHNHMAAVHFCMRLNGSRIA